MKIIKRNGSEVTFDVAKIENAIRKIRTTIKAAEKNPDDKWLYSRAAKAVQELQDMGGNL